MEIAFWTNSYPQYDHPVKTWLNWLTYSSIATILVEIVITGGVVFKAVQFCAAHDIAGGLQTDAV